MSVNRAFLGRALDDMVAAPASEVLIHTIFRTEDGVMICYGTPGDTDLEDTTDIYASGCIYIRSLVGGGSICYFNQGTKASPDFVPMSF